MMSNQARLDPEARRRDDRPAEGRRRRRSSACAPSAQAAGNLQSTPQQTVTTQSSSGGSHSDRHPAGQPRDSSTFPYYNPTWAYGAVALSRPTRRPTTRRRRSTTTAPRLLTGMMFGLGVAADLGDVRRLALGLWNGGGWGGSYTTVNVNRATSITGNNFNADRYRRRALGASTPAHRDGVPYRTPGRAPGCTASIAPDSAAAARAVPRPARRAWQLHAAPRRESGRGKPSGGKPPCRESQLRESRRRRPGCVRRHQPRWQRRQP
jgi:hypothetical protein